MEKLFKDNQQHQQKASQGGAGNELQASFSASDGESSQCYAIGGEGQIIKRFELIQGNGKRYSFSYALLPIYVQPDSSVLFIKSHELLIRISGYNLDPIREYLNTEQLLWAKASPSGKSDGTQSTFIQEISIQGDAVQTIL